MENVLSADGTEIAYERSGEGPAVVLVSGALCARAANAPLAALLEPHFTVFNHDRRGRGASGDTAPYAVEREIDDLAALIAAAGGSACVFGMSSGGVLALEAAARGLPITALALYEPPFDAGDDASRRRSERYAAELAGLLAEGRRGDAVELFMTHVGMPAEMVGRMRGAPVWPALEEIAPTLAYDAAVLDSAGGGTLPEKLVASVTAPALVLDGGNSPAWLRDTARRVAGLLPRGGHRTLDGQTHDYDPEVLAPALREFFTG